MSARPSRYGSPWSWDELILAFELYCRIPFKQTKTSHPEVRAVAQRLERSPAAIARKLGNFGAFDPELKKRNISGLVHGSRLDREVWDEFHEDWPRLVTAAHRLRSRLGEEVSAPPEQIAPPTGPSERLGSRRMRLHQWFFRQAVLSSYDGRCCVTGVDVPEVLIAAHIVPWSVDEQVRADPTNGLCLSATYDRLFDSGLMAINENLTIEFSRTILKSKREAVRAMVAPYHRERIRGPSRFLPNPRCLQWHREHVFRA